jgi:hypothetical protein
VPSGTAGRAQRAGVSESCAAWRTALIRPNPSPIRRRAVDLQPMLGAALNRGVAHVDRDPLGAAVAGAVELGGGQRRGGDRGLGRAAERERRRHHGVAARQADAVERVGRQAGVGPDARQRIPCRHRRYFPPVVMPKYSQPGR